MAVFVPLVHFQNHFLPKISFSLIRSDSSHEIVELSLIEHSVWTCQLYLFAIVDITFFSFSCLVFWRFHLLQGVSVSVLIFFSFFTPMLFMRDHKPNMHCFFVELYVFRWYCYLFTQLLKQHLSSTCQDQRLHSPAKPLLHLLLQEWKECCWLSFALGTVIFPIQF